MNPSYHSLQHLAAQNRRNVRHLADLFRQLAEVSKRYSVPVLHSAPMVEIEALRQQLAFLREMIKSTTARSVH